MSNLLCIYENRIATVFTTEEYYKRLSLYDNRITYSFVTISKVTNKNLQNTDVLLMIRPNNRFFARIARIAKKQGITVLFFLDDDLANMPANTVDIPWRKTGLIDSAMESDVLVSSSPRILDKYGDRANVTRRIMLDTAVDPVTIVEHRPHEKPISIVYAAGGGHEKVFDDLIRPNLEELDKKFGNHISLTFMSVHPQINVEQYRMKINYIPPLSLHEYRKKIAEGNYDIGLAPLYASEFSSCKYYNKFIEYSMFGIVGIYSNAEPYTYVVKDEENGILAENTPEEWMNAIIKAVENNHLTDECRENAKKLLLTKFSSHTIMDKYIEEIPELVSEHTERSFTKTLLPLYRFIYQISRIGDKICKSFFFLKTSGIKGWYQKVCFHLRVTRKVE